MGSRQDRPPIVQNLAQNITRPARESSFKHASSVSRPLHTSCATAATCFRVREALRSRACGVAQGAAEHCRAAGGVRHAAAFPAPAGRALGAEERLRRPGAASADRICWRDKVQAVQLLHRPIVWQLGWLAGRAGASSCKCMSCRDLRVPQGCRRSARELWTCCGSLPALWPRSWVLMIPGVLHVTMTHAMNSRGCNNRTSTVSVIARSTGYAGTRRRCWAL